MAKYHVIIEHDSDCESPREWHHISAIRMVSHGRWRVGDDSIHPDDLAELRKAIKNPRGDVIGISIAYTGDGDFTLDADDDDGGMHGIIYATKADIKKEFNSKIITAKIRAEYMRYLRDELDSYGKWLNGECYGYIIKRNGKEVDACWGYIGDDFCEESARERVKYFQEQDAKKKAERRKIKSIARVCLPIGY